MPSVSIDIAVRVLTKASKNDVLFWTDGVWKVHLTAPPIDGKANQALLKLLADRLNISLGQVVLKRGSANRNKIITIHGLSGEEICQRLPRK